ncbi:hypothetical protein [Actinocorallia sp. A-T 12471]|uniref:hypothetical protein n=1 Tax=Actinocorallia sp. A-T 12471 TaxID=3089813 RepID=UPI0029CC837C|nr:hypothetical protein [Actinocorallia sp. A-T 12471]MDX6739991.1 hypothetical protein [Actinocorallia sp. A-T 12471]
MRAGTAALLVGAAALPPLPAQAAPGDGVLVVHTTLTSAQPTRGEDVTGQVWVAAAGGTAANATLSFSATPNAGVALEAICTRTAQGYCKLGDVDAAGTSVPFTIRVKAGAAPLTVSVGAFARADGAEAVREYTEITFARTPPKTKTPEPSETPPAPAATPGETATPPVPTASAPLPAAVPGASVAPPYPSAGTADPGAGLPQVAGVPTAAPPGYVAPTATEQALPETELTGAGEVSPMLALGQSVWLGVLLAGCTLASAAAVKRGARIRHATAASGRRRRR